MSVPIDVEGTLLGFLKSYDRIGFGRRGVLDAEQEIRRFAEGLSQDDRAHFQRIVVGWVETAEAERVTASLHYNLPEHLQALAIRLCGTIPIPDSLPLLRRLRDERTFDTDEGRICLDVLHDSVQRLESGASERRTDPARSAT